MRQSTPFDKTQAECTAFVACDESSGPSCTRKCDYYGPGNCSCTDTVTTQWPEGLAHQTIEFLAGQISLCSHIPEMACDRFAKGYPGTSGGYPSGCDDVAFNAMLDSMSPTAPPKQADVDKQCRQCGAKGYYARISAFAQPIAGLVTPACRFQPNPRAAAVV
jgi:hypothetical protein